MGEVKSGNIHSTVKHLHEHVNIPAGGPIRTIINTLQLTYPRVQMIFVFLDLRSVVSKICSNLTLEESTLFSMGRVYFILIIIFNT
jgi:hypothetical protein